MPKFAVGQRVRVATLQLGWAYPMDVEQYLGLTGMITRVEGSFYVVSGVCETFNWPEGCLELVARGEEENNSEFINSL